MSDTQHSLCVSATLAKQIFGWSSPPIFYQFFTHNPLHFAPAFLDS